MSDPITDVVVAAAESVPGDVLILGALAIDSPAGWSPDLEAKLLGASPAPLYRHHAHSIARTWADVPTTSGAVIAAAMRSAVSAIATGRALNRVSLVWTGPPSEVLGLRSTRAVVNTIVANAVETLVLVSFAGYKVDQLAASLAGAVDRGVDVTLILETHDDSGGGLSIDAAKAFTALEGRARFYRWPLEARRAYFADSARLHAKCIIADRSKALITSANLTSAGINDNIELGTLIEAGPLPAKLHDHLNLLIEVGTLELVNGAG